MNASIELQFIAAQLALQAREPRWWCMDDQVKERYLAKARTVVADWEAEEKETEERNKREAGF